MRVMPYLDCQLLARTMRNNDLVDIYAHPARDGRDETVHLPIELRCSSHTSDLMTFGAYNRSHGGGRGE